jgi:enoyl-CoA hydratase/carnithine racemase
MSDMQISTQAGVRELHLNRPKKKNALTLAMYRELAEALSVADADPSVKVVLITGEGDSFCSGNDIADFVAAAGTLNPDSAPPAQFIRGLVTFGKPMVGGVQGAAVGIGATMLLHFDLVYASEDLKLSMPFVNLGLVPEAGSSLLLPGRVGIAVASEMLFLGAVIDARRARELGLVNDVVASPAEVRERARQRAVELAMKPPAALRATRGLLRGDPDALLQRVGEEARRFAHCLAGPEAREAFAAFLERRAPDFSRA